MPHRKLVKIGEPAKLPTIAEFFQEMAARQHEEIRKLKQEVAGFPASAESQSAPKDPRKPTPDPWLLHPVRIKRKVTPKKSRKSAGSKPARKASKKAAKNKSAKSKAAKKKPSKKAVRSRSRR